MRKILSMVLCLAMLMSLSVHAFAGETEGSDIQTVGETGATTATTPVVTECSHNWETVSSTDVTCTTDGSKTIKCSVCNVSRTETTPAKGHSYGSWTKVDNTNHTRSCACGSVETVSHTITTTETTAATCVTAGVKTHSCSGCGYSYTEEIKATGVHTYGDYTATVETHTHVCSGCQKEETGNHVFTESVTEAATCAKEGILADYCATCDYIVYEVIPKTDKHTYDNACDPDCNVCGIVRTVEHKYQAWWSKDYTGHWYACSICGDKGDFGKHYPGPAATEEKDQICLTCGYILTAKLNHEHNYGSQWTTDEGGHWYACAGCEDQKNYAGHVYDDQCDADCNICGYLTGNAHSSDGIWHSDEDGHWFVCTICNGVADAKPHTLPEEVSDTEAQYCADCGYEITPAQEHVHEYGDTWMTDEYSHWQECECGEKAESAAHIWGEASEQDAVLTYICEECAESYTEEAPEEEKSGFPWGIVLAVLLIALIAAVVALILVLKPKKSGKFRK